MMQWPHSWTSAWLLAAVVCGGLPAAARAQAVQEFRRMTLEELLNVDVSTVLRAEEPTISVPAAVFVITRDDIRRSGATTIPEALRLAPGVHVARIDAAKWAIGIRGFTDRLARSMLVLIDGRPVYSTLFAGTYWEVQDLLLEDVERIEVIRGPGGTLWGANAVNGIINVITRSAHETPGTFATVASGGDDRALAAVRFGGPIGRQWAARAFAKAFDRAPGYGRSESEYDGLRMIRFGGRADRMDPYGRSLALRGDVYAGRLDQRAVATVYQPPYQLVSDVSSPISGASVSARWSAPVRGGTRQVRIFFDRTSRDETPVAETRSTFDVSYQQSRALERRHTLHWGAAYRASADRITAQAPTGFDPASQVDHLVSAFGQDELVVVPDRLRLVAGAELSHNAYTGVEVQPSVRASWMIDRRHSLVGSVTRAVRTPSRVETDYTTTALASPEGPVFVRLLNNREFRAENLLAYELGYRARILDGTYVTASGFLNRMDDVLSTEALDPFVDLVPGPVLVIPVMFRNGLEGSSRGLEVTADVRPAAWWRWTGSYSYLRIAMERKPGSTDVSQVQRYQGLSPRHQFQVHAAVDAGPGWTVDWFVRYVSELRLGPVPGYATSNVRIGWQMTPQVELAVVGRNLHSTGHVEWGGPSGVPVRRTGHVQLTWRP